MRSCYERCRGYLVHTRRSAGSGAPRSLRIAHLDNADERARPSPTGARYVPSARFSRSYPRARLPRASPPLAPLTMLDRGAHSHTTARDNSAALTRAPALTPCGCVLCMCSCIYIARACFYVLIFLFFCFFFFRICIFIIIYVPSFALQILLLRDAPEQSSAEGARSAGAGEGTPDREDMQIFL